MNKTDTRGMLRRAETIKRKADELFVLTMSAFGADDYATTMTDNLTCAADDVIDHLQRRDRP